MVKTLSQVEKNVQASFGYVKKDLLMINDAISDIHDKIQHLSLNHAALLGRLEKIRGGNVAQKQPKKKKVAKKKKKAAKKPKSKKKVSKKIVKSKMTRGKTSGKKKATPKKVIKTEEIVY